MNLEDKFERDMEKLSWFRVIKWFMAIGLVVGVIGIGFNFISTASSVATAPGRVIQKTMDTNNIIQSYEWFYDVNASYLAKQGQIAQFNSFYTGESDKKERSRIRIEMAAIQQSCRDLAEKYNANSQKINKSIFKGWSLPEFLNQSNCE